MSLLTDPGGLASNSAADVRAPHMMLELNFAHDTVDYSDGAWVDVTSYLEAFRLKKTLKRMGQSPFLAPGSDPWSLDFTLTNLAGMFSAQRTDGDWYASLAFTGAGGNLGAFQMPVRFWLGWMDDLSAGGTVLGATVQGGGINSTQNFFTPSSTAGIVVGMCLRFGSTNDLFNVTRIAGGVVYGQRAVRDSTGAAQAAGTTISQVGALARQFSGMCVSWPESPSASLVTPQAACRLYGLLQVLGSTIVYQDIMPEDFIGHILDLMPGSPSYAPVPSGQRNFSHGLYRYPFAYLDKEPLSQEIFLSGAADGGVFYFDEWGVAQYKPATWWLGQAVDYTLGSNEYKELPIDIDAKEVFTRLTLEYSPRYLTELREVFRASRTFTVPPNGTYQFTAKLSLPVLVSTVITPVGGAFTDDGAHDDTRDFAAWAGSEDITASVTITAFVATGKRIDMTFTNASALPADIARLRIRACAISGSKQEEVTLDGTPVPGGMMRRDRTITESWYRQTESSAKGTGTMLLDKARHVRPTYRIDTARVNPLLTVGSKIQLTNPRPFSVDPTALITELEISMNGLNSPRPVYVMSGTAVDSRAIYGGDDTSVYFKMNSSLLGGTDVVIY